MGRARCAAGVCCTITLARRWKRSDAAPATTAFIRWKNRSWLLTHLHRWHRSMDILDAIQWPAMVVTVIAAWMVGSQKKFKRNWGFWLFLLSNVLWIVWGVHDHAYALISLQLCLAFLNIRGAMKNRSEA